MGVNAKSKPVPREIRDVAVKLFTGLDTARSLTALILMRNEQWDDLVQLKVDHQHYIDSPWGAEKLFRDSQATDFFRKCKDLPVDADPERAAIDLFWAAEAQCKATNDRLDKFLENPVLDGPGDLRILEFIEKVRRKLAGWLGPLPLHIEGRFGPGATYESKGTPYIGFGLTLGDKLQMAPSVTGDARSIFEHYFWPTAWGRAHLSFEKSIIVECRGNRYTTVDKTAMVRRGICIEPGGNIFLQLGIGKYLRRRLKRLGIDLKNGQPVHQQLARWASLVGDFATIDLSSASDTVAWKLVKLLLPSDWFDLLNSLRSRYTEIGGKWVKLEKFSSMGNGFTFELETLVFLALAVCTTDLEPGKNAFVYGDDIIVPTTSARGVLAVLRYFGFTPNERKTFINTAFRESCGGDFFCGTAVRPYFMEEFPHDPASWIALANGLFRVGRNAHLRSDPMFRARFSALGNLPVDVRRCRGPSALGDLVVNDIPVNWNYKNRGSQRWFRVWRPVSRRVRLNRFHRFTQLALALYGAGDHHADDVMDASCDEFTSQKLTVSRLSAGLVPRDSVSGYRFGRVAYS